MMYSALPNPFLLDAPIRHFVADFGVTTFHPEARDAAPQTTYPSEFERFDLDFLGRRIAITQRALAAVDPAGKMSVADAGSEVEAGSDQAVPAPAPARPMLDRDVVDVAGPQVGQA